MHTPYGDIPDRLATGMSLAEQHDWLAVRASRRTVLRGLVLAGASASPLFWQRPARAAADARVLGRLLAPGADPGRELTVGVAVPDAFRDGRVEATGAGGAGGAEAGLEVQMVRGSPMRYARAALGGLRPGTEYSYRVLLDGVAASTGTFRTAPAGAGDFRFTAFGDQGVGDPSRSVLNRLGQLRPTLHLVAGDICYANQQGDGGPGDFRPTLWDAWLLQNDPVARSVPFLCTLGNHEMEPGFPTHGYAGVLARVPMPGTSPIASPASWALRYGAVGFVGLDSNDVSHELPRNRGYSGGAQRAWLDSVLDGFRARGSGVEFVVAVLHHSPYSTNEAHASEGGVREQWGPLFDRYGVDLVVAGHNHCYERTLPLRGGKVTAFDPDRVDSTAGTTYVTAGGGGANATPTFIQEGKTRVATAEGQRVETIDWSLPGRTGTRAVLVADVRPGGRPGATSTMILQAVDQRGDVLDSVELSRPSTVEAVAPDEDGGWSTSGLVLAGAAAAGVAVGGVAGGLALRRRSTPRPAEPEPVPQRVVVRPLLERPDAEPPLDAVDVVDAGAAGDVGDVGTPQTRWTAPPGRPPRRPTRQPTVTGADVPPVSVLPSGSVTRTR